MDCSKEKYLKLLSKEYKNISEVSEEIINLKAIINLPKGTEVFLSDIHGEYEPFVHILNNGAGIIRNKIENVFENTITEKERSLLATLIYYPEEKLKLIKNKVNDLDEWYSITLYRLIKIARKVSSKYTRSKVRKAMHKGFDYIIDELLHSQGDEQDKDRYYKEIIKTIVDLKRADEFIVAISDLIKRMAIDHLHIIGDIFDRGRHPDLVMESLMNFHSLDIQWGNHDILWMGAACGNESSIANVVRICARYNNIGLLEDGYGINTRPLSTFALETYANDKCEKFMPKVFEYNEYDHSDRNIVAKIHKAITIIQFKLEGQLIQKHPEYKMEDKFLLDKINFKKGIVKLGKKEYKLNENNFPTINPNDVYELRKEEKEIIERLKDSPLMNGHIPVKAKDGESPIRANGKMLVIDGGFAKSYREKTGIAGYILTYNSHGLLLSKNKAFESIDKAIKEESDIISEIIVKENVERKTVGDTDIGKKLKVEIEDLKELLFAYKNGKLLE